jgi:hypothetical protein
VEGSDGQYDRFSNSHKIGGLQGASMLPASAANPRYESKVIFIPISETVQANNGFSRNEITISSPPTRQ